MEVILYLILYVILMGSSIFASLKSEKLFALIMLCTGSVVYTLCIRDLLKDKKYEKIIAVATTILSIMAAVLCFSLKW